jgi:hypothetical protein
VAKACKISLTGARFLAYDPANRMPGGLKSAVALIQILDGRFLCGPSGNRLWFGLCNTNRDVSGRAIMKFRRRFSAYYLATDLPADSQRVDVHGRLRSAVWPPICANCCAPAPSRLVVKKIFRRMPGGRHRGRGWKYVIRKTRIPYCASCMARNAELVAAARMPLGELLVRLVATPLIIPFVGGAIVARVFLPDVIAQPIGNPLKNVGLGVLAAMVLAMLTSAWGSWNATRFYLVPEQNEITSACDFSDELGGPFTGWHRAYAFRNRDYAEAFVAANRTHLWTKADTVRAGRIAFIGGLLLLAGLIVARILLVRS